MGVTMIEIDGARALELLHEAVEGNEEFVYRRTPDRMCQYVDNYTVGETGVDYSTARPSCLVGAALCRAGVPLDVLDTEGGVTDLAFTLSQAGVADLTQDARDLFTRAQEVQDEVGRTWGDALEAAVRERYGQLRPV